MTCFTINFDGTKVNQQQLIDRLKSNGYDVIQVSDGLIAKVERADESIPDLLGDLSSGVSVELLNVNRAAQDARLSKDARLFVGL